MNAVYSFGEILWNLWCIFSVVGIWPRFIEPRLIKTTHCTVPVPHLPQQLEGLKILQFSDLHLNSSVPDFFLKKLLRKIQKYHPDIIVFTGDFLAYSCLDHAKRLYDLLSAMKAPYGCYAILGNHDYEKYVSVNQQGDYDIIDSKMSTLRKGWKRLLLSTPTLTKQVTSRSKTLSPHAELLSTLRSTPFKLLHNETITIPVRNHFLNISGLGEHTLGQCRPEIAFKTYDTRYPGIVLTHNPDSLPSLEKYPGTIALCGHTHGGQINLPLLVDKFLLSENKQWKSGAYTIHNRWVYINRGIGSVMCFRWFAAPEITLVQLKRQDGS